MSKLSWVLLLLTASACEDQEKSGFDAAAVAERIQGNAPFKLNFQGRNNGPLEHQYSWNWSFGDGEIAEGVNPEHTFEEPGDYLVQLLVRDLDDGLSAQAELKIQVHPPADLQISELSFAPLQLSSGGEVQLNWSFQNRGAQAFGGFDLLIFLSKNPQRPLDAPVWRRLHRVDQEPGAAELLELSLQVPEELPSGEYWLGVLADPEENIGERERENNLGLAPLPLRLNNPRDDGPNLVICGLRISSFEAIPLEQTPSIERGEQLEAEVCLGNTGNRPTIGAAFSLLLSSDEQPDPEDQQLSFLGELALGAGERREIPTLLDLSPELSPGLYHLLALADPEERIEEQQEDDNLRVWSDPFLLAEEGAVEGVDLIIRSLSLGPEIAYWGQNLSGSLQLENRGTLSVERFFVLRLLAEPVGGGEAIQLRSENLSGLPAGELLELALSLPITRRLPAGEYRISAVADPSNSSHDVNPGNNRRSQQAILSLGGEPDLDPFIQGLSFEPSRVEVGQHLNLSAEIGNLGRDTTGDLEAIFILSADERFDSGADQILERFEVDPIPGGESVQIQRALIIPEELDQQVLLWRVGLVVDPDDRLQGERDEENNFRFAQESLEVEGATGGCREDLREGDDEFERARLLEPGSYPELGACDEADWQLLEIPPGQISEWRLSWDPEEGELEMRMFDEEGEPLHRAGGASGSLSLVLESSEEPRSPRLQIRPLQGHFSYALEYSQGSPPEAPDLRLRDARAIPALIQAGAQVELSVELLNLGGEPALDSLLKLSLSADTLGEEALPLSELRAPALLANEAQALNLRLEMPEELEDQIWFLILEADADDEVEESDEENRLLLRLLADAEQACQADPLEPNGSPFEEGGAPPLAAPLQPGVQEELRSCRGDDDWYRLEGEAGDQLEVRLDFEHEAGDLELALYAADMSSLLAESRSLQNREMVRLLRVQESGPLFLRVYLAPGDELHVANSYRLELIQRAAEECSDDGFEPNGSEELATLLADGRHQLSLCPGDEDWFRFPIPAGNSISLQVASGAHPVQLSLFAPQGELLGESERRISYEAQLNGEYRVRARSEAPEVIIYELTLAGVSGVDLAVSALRLSGHQLSPGGDLRVEGQLQNLRGDGVEQALLRFLFSIDELPSPDDWLLAERRLDLPGAAQLPFQQRLTLPANLPAGEGYLLASLDPEREHPDIRPGNNSAAAPLEVEARCEDDDLRENEGPSTATPLEGSEGLLKDRVICPFTEDWYLLPLPLPADLVLRLEFEQDLGDLDLQVWDLEEQLLGESRGEEDGELVELEGLSPGSLLIRVDGFFDAHNEYSLVWELR